MIMLMLVLSLALLLQSYCYQVHGFLTGQQITYQQTNRYEYLTATISNDNEDNMKCIQFLESKNKNLQQQQPQNYYQHQARRDVLIKSFSTIASMTIFGTTMVPLTSNAADEIEAPTTGTTTATTGRQSLDTLLYRIIRVREATQQETRLISTGMFKDIQRANIKLAIKFMIENYRLNDAFVAASTYIDGSTTLKLEAGQVGQRAVQNLYTILEYFDSSDVQNLKVGQLSGKDSLVLKGLDATRQNIDDFLNYFPKSTVDSVIALVEKENELNVKEYDPALGKLVNMPITKYR